MSELKPYDAYDNFAWFYDKYWRTWPKTLLPILERTFFPLLPSKALILDLCCGQGHVSALFLERGHRVIGVDGSIRMLEYARQNAPAMTLIHADARSFSVPEFCDAAVSTYDSLNHILTIEELGQTFAGVRRALKPGAPFLFDLNVDEGFRKGWQGSIGQVGDDNAIIRSGSYDPETKCAELAITMFRLQEESWHRTDLKIQEKCYSDAEILEALGKNRFGSIQLFNPARDFGWSTAGRFFYLARAER